MPIRIPDNLPARKTLEDEGVVVMDSTRAARQDIRADTGRDPVLRHHHAMFGGHGCGGERRGRIKAVALVLRKGRRAADSHRRKY